VKTHDLHLLTGCYALDALPDNEVTAVERHLDRCPSCTDEVRGLRETAARLAMATAVTPPPQLRARVLAAAPLTRQLPPAGRGALSRTGLGRLSPGRLSARGTALTAAIVTLAAAVAFLLVLTLGTNSRLHQEQSASQAIAAVLAAPDARIKSAPATVGGRVTAVVSLTHGAAVVTAADLPRPAGTNVYQLWVITAAGTARSAGLLTQASPGSTTPLLAGGVRPGDELGITVEPAGGTSQPTTTPVMLLPVAT
jgi:anti-sigma factor RsiW